MFILRAVPQLTIRNAALAKANGLEVLGLLSMLAVCRMFCFIGKIHFTMFRIAIQCCEYAPLVNSTDRGIAVVNPGQIVIGGEILSGERLYAFDYIKDVTKHTKSDGTVSYEVAVRRMACVPHPNEFTVNR